MVYWKRYFWRIQCISSWMEIIWKDSFLYISIHVISTIRYITMACSPDRVLHPVIVKVKVQFPVKPEFFGSLYVSGKLLTYPSPKPTFPPKWEVSVNVGLGEGKWAVSQKRIVIQFFQVLYQPLLKVAYSTAGIISTFIMNFASSGFSFTKFSLLDN